MAKTYDYIPSFSINLDFPFSLAVDAFALFNHSFTNKFNTVTAAVDSKGGIDVAGTGIYKCLSGTYLTCDHFNPADKISVSFSPSNCFGLVSIDFCITDPQHCFVAGTAIETIDGPRAVESIEVGDQLWAFGRVAPVTWVGNRTIDVSTVADQSLVLPVRIRAGALTAGLPERDLVVSPDHAIWLDGRLIPARLLVNGVSILQEFRREITYFHVALDRHDLILAEGVQVESYLDVANLSATPLAIEQAPAPAVYAEHGFAPLCLDPELVKPVWDSLSARAGTSVAANDVVPAGSAPFALLADGQLIAPDLVGTENGARRFRCVLPVGARLLTLASAAASPWSVSPWLDDRRQLGVAVSAITADGATLALDGEDLVRGWHGVETTTRSYRWTDGAAVLVVPAGTQVVEIDVIAVAATNRIAVAA